MRTTKELLFGNSKQFINQLVNNVVRHEIDHGRNVYLVQNISRNTTFLSSNLEGLKNKKNGGVFCIIGNRDGLGSDLYDMEPIDEINSTDGLLKKQNFNLTRKDGKEEK